MLQLLRTATLIVALACGAALADIGDTYGSFSADAARMAGLAANSGAWQAMGKAQTDRVAGRRAETSRRVDPQALRSLTFLSDPRVSARSVQDFREQLIRAHGARATDIDRALTQDWLRGYRRDVATPYGLDPQNLADAYTAYLLAGWGLAHGEQRLDRRAVAAVRDHARARLARQPQLMRMSDAEKQALAEEASLHTVLILANHTQAVQARDEGLRARARAHYANSFRRLGVDLGALALTRQGLVERR